MKREIRRQNTDEIVGSQFGLKSVMSRVEKVASLDSPVLLLGETGVGKDVIANNIHYSSPRKGKPMVKVNCGAIPDSLIDSELFGYEKGAFTGAAKSRKGKFERADQGTIFLDEIGELPPQAQTRLLRVLQDKVIERVGGDSTILLDLRIVAATNRNLEDMVLKGTFREDLWYRLNVFPVLIPPLRDRTIDIPALVQFFLQRKAKELKLKSVPQVKPGALDVLSEYPWPGNVRELQNIIEREIIINPEGPVDFQAFQSTMRSPTRSDGSPSGGFPSLNSAVAQHIQRALQRSDGKIHGTGGAAELLGMNPNTLRSKIKKLASDYDF